MIHLARVDFFALPLVFILGLILGSFANVVIHRTPKGLSLIRPGSACPKCSRELSWLENIPVFSYLFLRGRCRGCGERISLRYPMVELLTGLLWVMVTLRIGLRAELAAYLLFATVLVILSAIDLEVRRIPNRILAPAFIAALPLLAVAASVSHNFTRLGIALLGAVLFAVPMLVLALIAPGGMGMGDVKLAGYLGLHLGWLGLLNVLTGAMAGFTIGAVAGVGLIAIGRKGRKDSIPFGPSMAAGALLIVFAGGPILRVWLSTPN